ncbi:MAG: PhnB protein [Acidimicrobiaceae bacterium]|jgi:PhnB protein|nr:PhnB protein [Acidimicrobiaceae bacterium]
MTSIAPWLSVPNATDALGYYQAAFGAIELERLEDDGDVVVAQLSIDGAEFWVQTEPESSPAAFRGMSVRMILTVDDPDATYARAVAAGATEVNPVSEDYGWRIGRIADPSGHHWEIGKRLPT